ncbi:amino acid ABC transporter permease [Bradyrhizobium brasilense]|uniref:amino acid ABC transporter permease n=1 Tax=Bradyrhizobium brasilense TaxID=1419277 RepID=UPI001E3626A6|nr:amino acid ABC transporter permease [Bradyrhizobium brasilense]MCC8973559.1 amino acid ABC transporter permease [Bradyrhizobium brasilense]
MKYDWSVVWQYRDQLFDGVVVTVLLTVITMAVAIPGGIAVMMLRQSKLKQLNWAGTFFVESFRNLPLILLIYWAFYVLPIIVEWTISPVATGVTALALAISAYNAETFRAGVNSIRKGQSDAALALGMSRWQVMHRVILPQAVRRILPVLASTWVSLFKDTSLVSVIAVGDLAYNAMQVRSQTFRILEMLTAMAVIYWCLGYPQAKLVDWIHRKYGAKE